PWEGRMVAFGDPSPASLEYRDKNNQIQKVLLATRPFGTTPIAGMFEDARDFLTKDPSTDPLAPTRSFGPAGTPGDPYVKGDCRQQVIVLISDGQPNTDLRPFC